MMELVIASANSHKIAFLREILSQTFPQLQILSLYDFPQYHLPLDTEDAIAVRAKIKALDAAKALNKRCLVEQWQLCIPVLGETQKELFTASRIKSSKQIVAETKAVLKALEPFKSEFERSAYLESAIAIAYPDGTCKEAIGRAEGTIAEQEKGEVSFNFDSIFVMHDYRKTLAELTSSTKVRVSHCRKAIEKLIPYI